MDGPGYIGPKGGSKKGIRRDKLYNNLKESEYLSTSGTGNRVDPHIMCGERSKKTLTC